MIYIFLQLIYDGWEQFDISIEFDKYVFEKLNIICKSNFKNTEIKGISSKRVKEKFVIDNVLEWNIHIRHLTMFPKKGFYIDENFRK